LNDQIRQKDQDQQAEQQKEDSFEDLEHVKLRVIFWQKKEYQDRDHQCPSLGKQYHHQDIQIS